MTTETVVGVREGHEPRKVGRLQKLEKGKGKNFPQNVQKAHNPV